MRERFAALGSSRRPTVETVTAFSELTTEHLAFLRPHFFAGGRWEKLDGVPPVPLHLDRAAFIQAFSAVLSLPPRSMLEVFTAIEALDHAGDGATWEGVVKFVRQTVEAELSVNPGRNHTGRGRGAIAWSGKDPDGHRLPLANCAVRLVGDGYRMAFLKIVGARKLAATDHHRSTANPSCVVWFNEERVYTTTTKFSTTEPRWDENVMLRVPSHGQINNALCVEVWDQTVMHGPPDGREPRAAGVLLGRVLLCGASLERLMEGERKAAFHLESDPDKAYSTCAQGMLALQVLGSDPARDQAVDEYVAHTCALEEARRGASTAHRGTAASSAEEAAARAEQLRAEGRPWDDIVQIMEAEHAESALAGDDMGSDDDDSPEMADEINGENGGLWWSRRRMDHDDVRGVPRFIQPTEGSGIGCRHEQMVDRLAVLDGYGAVASCCRDGIVRLWDATSLLPAQPRTVQPPTHSLRPMLSAHDPRIEELRLQQEGLRRLRENLTEAERRNRQINTAHLFGPTRLRRDATSAERGWHSLMTKSKAKRKIEILWSEVQKETEAVALLADQVQKNREDTEALAQKLPMDASTPGLLSKYTRPGPRQRECWALDAATLQVPPQWVAAGFHTHVGQRETNSRGSLSARRFGATWNHCALPAWLRDDENNDKVSGIEVAPPPRPWPVVFLCADSTIRLWECNSDNPNGSWCKRAPYCEGQLSLKNRTQSRVLAAPIDCVPVCLARARPAAVSSLSWSDLSDDWVQTPRVVVGGSDGTIRAWECSWDGRYWELSPQSHYNSQFHSDQVLCCLRATPYYMVSGGLDSAVILGDQHRWKAIWKGVGHTKGGVNSVDFDTRSQLIVSGGSDRRIAIWDVSSGPSPVAMLPIHAPIVSVNFSNGHSGIVSAAYVDQTVRLWDIRMHPRCLQQATDASDNVVPLAPFDTGRYTASCFDPEQHTMLCAGRTVVAWKIRPHRPRQWRRFWRHKTRLVLVFLRWYVMNRKCGKTCAHNYPLLVAEFVPELCAITTVDVVGTVRFWSPEKSIDGVKQGAQEEYKLLGHDQSGELGGRLAAATVVSSRYLGAPAGPRLVVALHSGAMSVYGLVRGAPANRLPFQVLPGVPCQPRSILFSMPYATRTPVLVLGRDGSVWLCALAAPEAAQRSNAATVPRPRRLLLPGEGGAATAIASFCAQQYAVSQSAAAAFGAAAVVLCAVDVTHRSGEAPILGVERGSGKASGLISTPPQPALNPEPFGDPCTCVYLYDPPISQLLVIEPDSSREQQPHTPASKTKASRCVSVVARASTERVDELRLGLLLVLRADGVVHVVSMEAQRTVHPFAVTVGGGALLGGWDPERRLLLSGNRDGFCRVLRVARGPLLTPDSTVPGESSPKLLTVERTFRAHVAAVKTIDYYKGQYITSAADGSVSIWARDTQPLRSLGTTPAAQISLKVGKSHKLAGSPYERALRAAAGRAQAATARKRRFVREQSLLTTESVAKHAAEARSEISTISRGYRQAS